MTRREIREHLLMLFRKEFHDNHDLMEQVKIYLSDLKEPTKEEGLYLNNRFQAILEKLTSIDDLLSEAASGWTLGRMGRLS